MYLTFLFLTRAKLELVRVKLEFSPGTGKQGTPGSETGFKVLDPISHHKNIVRKRYKYY